MSSRICVKNLPKYVTENRLRMHFAQKGEVTDAKIMKTKDGRSRLFGFVGFKTPQEAKLAVQFFNNSFLDTAKVSVEVAKQIGDDDVPRPWSKYSKGSSAYAEREEKEKEKKSKEEEEKEKKQEKKRKRKEQQEEDSEEQRKQRDEVEKRLKDFLAVAAPKKSTKLWQDELGFVDNNAPQPPTKKQKTEKSNTNANANNNNSNTLVNVEEKPVFSKKFGGEALTKKHMKFVQNEDEQEGEGQKQQEKEEEESDVEMTAVEKQHQEQKEYEKQHLNKAESKLSDLDWLKKKKSKPVDFGSLAETMDEKKDEIEKQVQSEKKNEKSEKKSKSNTTNESTSDSKSSKKSKEKETQEEQQQNEDDENDLGSSGRLFVRNLSYSTTEEELRDLFQKYGPLSEVHLPLDSETKKSKAFAFVTYIVPENAIRAMNELDAKIFQGRLMHILPAKPVPTAQAKPSRQQQQNSKKGEGSAFKSKSEQELKANSERSYNWNSLFMASDAIADSIAQKLGVSKADLLSRDADNAAVRLALAESQILMETKQFLQNEGVSLEALSQQNNKAVKRSNQVILTKNIPFNTEVHELSALFGKYGSVSRVVLPPARTIALLEFVHANDAKQAFRDLSYTRFKHLPLKLEWAPIDILGERKAKPVVQIDTGATKEEQHKQELSVNEEDQASAEQTNNNTLFVKNLSFGTSEETLRKLFEQIGIVRNITIAQKKNPKDPNKTLSMGFGFVEFNSREDVLEAMKRFQGHNLEGHEIQLKFSQHKFDKEPERKKTRNLPQTTKLIIKNLAFEVTKKDLKELCGAVAQLKSVRIPKKFEGQSRGFGFVEYLTQQEAQNAFNALQGSHLYGRRLVIEYAEKDTDDVDLLRLKTASTAQTNN